MNRIKLSIIAASLVVAGTLGAQPKHASAPAPAVAHTTTPAMAPATAPVDTTHKKTSKKSAKKSGSKMAKHDSTAKHASAKKVVPRKVTP